MIINRSADFPKKKKKVIYRKFFIGATFNIEIEILDSIEIPLSRLSHMNFGGKLT
jgi:hypothetical protein